MGGHGGLNILPQKKWNVYNFDNREKVRLDEEAAAREEQLKREEIRKRDAEFRLEQLRRARGLDPIRQATGDQNTSSLATPTENKDEVSVELRNQSETDSRHMNLFEGIKIFDPIVIEKKSKDDDEGSKRKKMRKEPEPRVVGPEDEKYRMGYGLVGKGVKAPWYTMKPGGGEAEEKEMSGGRREKKVKQGLGDGTSSGKKKTLEELREERLNREKKEKERERALLLEKRKRDGSFSRDRSRYRRS